MQYTLEEAARIMGGTLHKANAKAIANGVSIDSRQVKKGELFFGIRGTRVDGSRFAREAVSRGAIAAIVPKGKMTEGVPSIFVDEPVLAMGRLAKFHRISKINGKVIGITGSVGKTTTTNFLSELLLEKFKVSRTIKSYNDAIGLPISVLSADEDADFVVLEYGISHPYEMDYLLSIVKPDNALITKIGKSHLEFLQTVEMVAIEKAKILKVLPMLGIAELYKNSPFTDILTAAIPKMVKVLYYEEPEVMEIAPSGMKFKYREKVYGTGVIGSQIATNIAASITMARELGVDEELINEGVSKLTAMPMRMEVLKLDDLNVILDCYNSNPESQKALIDTASMMKGCDKKIFLLGDMLELGKKSAIFHREIGKYLGEHTKADLLITTGEFGMEMLKGAAPHIQNARYIEKYDEIVDFLSKTITTGCLFVKASRKLHLESIIKALRELK